MLDRNVYLEDSSECATSESSTPTHFGLLDDFHLGQIGLDVGGSERLGLDSSQHSGQIHLQFGPQFFPVVMTHETNNENYEDTHSAHYVEVRFSKLIPEKKKNSISFRCL